MAYPNNSGFRNTNPNNERNPSPPFASTPIINRSRPRFAYSGPPNYPRPGSSATKPNPSGSFAELMRSRYVPSDSMSDSMVNNCGDSMQYMDSTFQNDNGSFMSDYDSGSSFQSQNSSLYYSCNESFGGVSPRKPFPRLDVPQAPPMDGPLRFQTPQQSPPLNRPPGFQSSPVSHKNQFKSPSSVLDPEQTKPHPYMKPKNPFRKSDWRCDLCDINFTSRHPFAMHFQGSKHAKKLKMQESLQTIQSQVTGKEIIKVGSTFRCDICGVIANSTFQLKTHLDGLKHKAKVAQIEKEEVEKIITVEAEVKGKGEPETNANGAKTSSKDQMAVVSILPNLDAPAKKSAVVPPKHPFSCSVCNVILNSKLQYDQHMNGKFHKARVEGRPLPYSKKNVIRKSFAKVKNPAAADNATEVKDLAQEIPEVATTTPAVKKFPTGILKNKAFVPLEQRATPELSSTVAESVKEAQKSVEKPQTVIGVKTLASSFVAGATMK